ncbi:UNVERIFIED_CONTAM: hypothetical protein GTU68_000388 [Idotea baltica]|nr:hypothetical protein [Idotea baltica]
MIVEWLPKVIKKAIYTMLKSNHLNVLNAVMSVLKKVL